MSAYLVTKRHIDTLVTFAIRPKYGDKSYYYYQGEPHFLSGRPDEIGQILWDENRRSVNYRYDEQTPVEPYTFRHIHVDVSPVQIIKACNCLNYQSCETPDWGQTEAFAILDAIRERAIHELPGYDEAEWLIA